jgi:hypothetical protein
VPTVQTLCVSLLIHTLILTNIHINYYIFLSLLGGHRWKEKHFKSILEDKEKKKKMV